MRPSKLTYPVDVLYCPTTRGPKVAAGGARQTGWVFPRAVREKLIEDCKGLSVLHLFGGLSTFGTRIDCDPSTHPDVLGDAFLPPFARESFDVVILDPPYVHMNAQMKCALFRAAGFIARKRVVWFSTIWMAGSGGLQSEAAWLVRVRDSCAVRCLQYFRVNSRPGPVRRFKRGPQIRYNRWLAQPQGLALQGDIFGKD